MSLVQADPTPHLVLGGARSGKSSYAERLITSLPAPYVYVATAEVLDDEMRERVERHKERRKAHWHTIESPMELTETLRSLQSWRKPVLVDCLTLWLSNLLHNTDEAGRTHALEALCSFLQVVDYPLVIVSNEVGSGIVPENALARRFRDLAGFANQKVAAICPSVTSVIAGLPLRLK